MRQMLDRRLGKPHSRKSRGGGWCGRAGSLHNRGRRADVFDRQVKRKSAADPGGAPQLDLAAEQTRQLAADRQAKTCAAEPAIGARIGLLKRLENDLLLLRGNADTGVRDLEGDDARRVFQDGVIGTPAADRWVNAQFDATLLGELEGVRQ